MRQLWAKFAEFFGSRQRRSEELQHEMEAHLEFLIEENIERGMSSDEAVRNAQRAFSGRTQIRERTVQSWQFSAVESLLQDIRYALRGILRAPVFSLIVVVTLAVGIGASTSIFSAVYAVLLKPLPYPQAERLLWLGESSGKANGISVTWLNFQHWQKDNRSFDAMAGFVTADHTLTGQGQAVLTHAGVVTNDFFALTGAQPTLGRLFTVVDDDPHAPPVVIVNGAFWMRSLSADPRIVGKTITLDGNAVTVIGVLARDPGFFSRPVDYYLPYRPSAQELIRRDAHHSMRVLALLKQGVSLDAARADIDTIMRRLAAADPGPENDHRLYAQFLTVERTGDVKPTFVLLLSSVAVVLILACANIGGLLLIRATTRARELAIRTAIGAGRSRLGRQLLTETVVISLIGGLCGVGLAAAGLRLLQKLGPQDIPRLSEAGINVPVLVFALALTLAVGLICALVPIGNARHVNISILLKEGSTGAGSGSVGHALRSALVVTEIAAAVVLLFTAGVLLRSLWAAQNVSPGFEPRNLLALELQLPGGRYASDSAVLDFYARLETALQAQPGVEAVGAVNCPPAAGDCGDWWYSVAEKPAPGRDDVPMTLINSADSSYFQTARIPLLAGRGPGEQDRAASPLVVVINAQIARTWWKDPHEAIGHHIKLGGPYVKGPVLEIVGVAGDVPQMGLDGEPAPQMYLPAAQHVNNGMVVMIRTRGETEALAPAVRRTLASIDSTIPIQSLKTADAWLGASLTQRRFITFLLSLFACVAVILAIIGCYGVLNFWVSSRRQEIAIRMAMGAGTGAILARTGRQAIRLGAIGLVLGVAASWGASHWVSHLLFGVRNHDPATLAAAAMLAVLLLFCAAALPLWRATQVDPIRTLRES